MALVTASSRVRRHARAFKLEARYLFMFTVQCVRYIATSYSLHYTDRLPIKESLDILHTLRPENLNKRRSIIRQKTERPKLNNHLVIVIANVSHVWRQGNIVQISQRMVQWEGFDIKNI